MKELAGIGKKSREKLGRVLKVSPNLLTSLEVSTTLGVSKQEASRLLSRWCNSGWISRVKRGVYVPLSIGSSSREVAIEEPFLIASSLFGSGYIGGFSAVKHWDFSEQIMEVTTYFTLKKVKERNLLIGGSKFHFKTTSDYKVFGLKGIWIGNQKIMISDPIKTIIDILDDPRIVGGIRIICDIFEEFIDSEYFDMSKLIDYGLKMKNRTIFKRLGFILDTKFHIEVNEIEKLRGLISSSYSDLDPTLKCEHYLKNWKLKVSSSWKKEYDRER